MSHKVIVSICGRSYNLVVDDDSKHIEKVAAQVDKSIYTTMRSARVTPMDAAVLTAVNAVDALFQEQDTTEALRLQVQGLLEETKRLRQELADARRELTRTKNTKKPSK